jgi:hypothetical protein
MRNKMQNHFLMKYIHDVGTQLPSINPDERGTAAQLNYSLIHRAFKVHTSF